MSGSAVHRVLFKLGGEVGNYLNRNVVHKVVVVAVLRELTLDFKVNSNAVFVAYRLYLRELINSLVSWI